MNFLSTLLHESYGILHSGWDDLAFRCPMDPKRQRLTNIKGRCKIAKVIEGSLVIILGLAALLSGYKGDWTFTDWTLGFTAATGACALAFVITHFIKCYYQNQYESLFKDKNEETTGKLQREDVLCEQIGREIWARHNRQRAFSSEG